jgi:5,10-methylenetetrahydrofolate reductase
VFDRALDALRPLARRVGYARLERPVAAFERATKGALFDCRMCGACALSVTGMSCPMNCPKSMRNGPCGGARADGGCEVEPAMRCVWIEANDGAARMRAGALPTQPNPPLEHHLQGRSSWLRVLRQEPWPASLVTQAPPRTDDAPAASRLEALLRTGAFVVTSECSPPDSADPDDVLARTHHYEGWVDALNVTDAPGAHCHMSSLGVSLILARRGWEPVMQMTCRDRNRIAIQGDILAAAALGIGNLLCLTGDGIGNGDDPGAKPVFDLDAVSLLDTARRLRDDGLYRSGRALTGRPRLFLGAVDNPFAPPFDLRPMRLGRKVAAGARFVQTQYCFDVPMLERYMAAVRAQGLHRRCHVLVGVGPLTSARTARWMREHVPGVHVPDELIARIERARDPVAEGVRLCVEQIERIRAIEGVAGIHLMAPKREHLIAQIVSESGVLRGRTRPVRPTGELPCPSPA